MNSPLLAVPVVIVIVIGSALTMMNNSCKTGLSCVVRANNHFERGVTLNALPMHILDYAIIGFLIACLIWAGAMVFYKAR